jgi:hypothetical protein
MSEMGSAPATSGAETGSSQVPPNAAGARQETIGEKIRRLARPTTEKAKGSKIVVILGWSLVALAFLLLLPLAYLCWYFLPPYLWGWATKAAWHWIAAVFGFLFIWMPPIWGAMAASSLTGFVVDLSLSAQEAAVHKAQQDVRETEEDAIRRLEQTDTAGLLPLLKYSRAQLFAYYQMGLNQAKGSFFNSVVAMWLGFGLLLIGVALFVGPVEKIGLKRPPSTDIEVVVMGGAAIIEFVSALFLWVYQSSIAQLTFFYNSQMHSHTSILCFRIASTMDQQKADDAKRAIIDKVLDWNLRPERPKLRGGKGMLSVLSKADPSTAAGEPKLRADS